MSMEIWYNYVVGIASLLRGRDPGAVYVMPLALTLPSAKLLEL